MYSGGSKRYFGMLMSYRQRSSLPRRSAFSSISAHTLWNSSAARASPESNPLREAKRKLCQACRKRALQARAALGDVVFARKSMK
jgi:hypothetical protein